MTPRWVRIAIGAGIVGAIVGALALSSVSPLRAGPDKRPDRFAPVPPPPSPDERAQQQAGLDALPTAESGLNGPTPLIVPPPQPYIAPAPIPTPGPGRVAGDSRVRFEAPGQPFSVEHPVGWLIDAEAPRADGRTTTVLRNFTLGVGSGDPKRVKIEIGFLPGWLK